jgi:hypothetical protein
MGTMEQTIETGVSQGRLATIVMPVLDEELTGDEC